MPRFQRLFAPTPLGAVALACALHLVVLAAATVLGHDMEGSWCCSAWNRWDTSWYEQIARDGYSHELSGEGAYRMAFFPLFPLLMRAASLLGGSLVVSGVLVSACATLVASRTLFELIRLDDSPANARRAVAWLNFFPTSFFLVAAYTEATFLCFALLAFLAARKDRYLSAGIAGALCGATRLTGLALLPALAVEALLTTRERGDGRYLRRLAPLVLIAPLGFLSYLAINWWMYGRATQFLDFQLNLWQHLPVPPWSELLAGIRMMHATRMTVERVMLHDAKAASILIVFATVVFAALRLRLSYTVFALAAGWLATGVSWDISAPRYALAVWPMFWGLARLTRHQALGLMLGGVSGFLLAFVAAQFMAGGWAY